YVFSISSDSLFIEKVYNEAMLYGRANYILVDDFDEETARKFLERYKFSEEEINKAFYYFGGKPIYLTMAIIEKRYGKNILELANEILERRKGQIREIVFSLEDKNKEQFEKIIKIFDEFKNEEFAKYKYVTEEIRLLADYNIIFVDPSRQIIKPQSRIDLLAMREILKEVK
ncbi:MAG: ATP-binding protein, partial [Candidatus Altarchaeaceae archaeon]